jgi:hypothetical protein
VILVAASSEEIDCLVKTPIKMAIEVSAKRKKPSEVNLKERLCPGVPDELIDDVLVLFVEVLELVHGRKALYVEAIRRNNVGFSTEEILRLEARDVTNEINKFNDAENKSAKGEVPDGSEDVRASGGAYFNPVAMVDLTIASFLIRLDISELAIKIDVASSKIATK